MDVCIISNIEHEILYFIAYLYFQIILLYWCDIWYSYWAVKLTLLYFFYSSQSYRMLMVGYGMDLRVSECIDRVSLIPDQRIEGISIVIMQVLLIIIRIKYYGC